MVLPVDLFPVTLNLQVTVHLKMQSRHKAAQDHYNYENWLAAGSKSIGDSANALIREILQWHEVSSLAPEIERAVRDLAIGSANGQ